VAERVPALILARIRRATAAAGGVEDADLLRRFAADRDESAFELLLWRHARLVFGVCLRILRDEHDAEDAFQASFLALARHAGRINRRESVACWLHNVACRVAMTTRRRRSTLAARERLATAAAERSAAEPSAQNCELRDVLDREIGRLPQRFRSPVVLCYLEGKTVDEAAVLLGCPRGTLASRLARARQRLRAGLTRRGFDPSALPAVVIPADSVLRSYSLIPSLTAAITGRATAVSPRVVALTGEVLRAMFLNKIKTGVVIPSTFLGILLTGAGLAIGLQPRTGPAAEPPRPAVADDGKPAEPKHEVTVSRPTKRDTTPVQDYTGRLEARQSVDIRPAVDGVVVKVNFKAGADVKNGDVLFELDPRAATLTLQKAEADLASALAKKQQASADLDRIRRLSQLGQAAHEDLDARTAQVAVTEAAVKAAQVEVARGKLDLDATRIVAPMSGQVGWPLVEPGSLVFHGPDRASVLTTVTALDPIGVTFDMDERSFLDYARLAREKKLKEPGPLKIALTGDEGFPREAKLEGFDGHLNPETGTVRVRGTLANPDRLLLPGMFAKVRMMMGPPQSVLVVPGDALLNDQGQVYVLIVNDKNVVERRPVTAPQIGGEAADAPQVITKGLQDRDWVIVTGQNDVHPGDKVTPKKQEDTRH
jgi:RND family efflux transporter MFP subunit